VSDACHRHGKGLGVGGINADENTRRYIGMGARFITTAMITVSSLPVQQNRRIFIVNWRRRPQAEGQSATRINVDHVLEIALGIVKQPVGGAALGVSVRTSIRRSHVNAFKCIEWST
jgi:hypothetical protein